MATVTFFHDTRSGSGDYPLKLRITHKGKSVHINLGVKIPIENWDANENKIVGMKKEASLNDFIVTKKNVSGICYPKVWNNQ